MFVKLIILTLLLYSLVDCHPSSYTTDEEQTDSANQVKIRVLGKDDGKLFNLLVDRNLIVDGMDGFYIKKAENESSVNVIGNTAVSACWGLLHYLKYYCHAHISWDGDNLDLPEPLPVANLTLTSLDKWRFYQNVVTSSYSFVWWSWERWEREIDWMALNGINLALAFNGQEAIWERVYHGFNINDDFTGPGFLAWNRMGNMRSFGGGITTYWHEQQIILQHKILKRMRSLGIIPVIPAFSGLLPHSFTKAYPLAKVSTISRWNNFNDSYCCPILLDPADPMFSLISRIFLREYIEEFGTDHVYSCDTFNENTPASNDIDYLNSLSKGVYEGISQIDPKAIWMLQGWMFIHPFWGNEQVKAYVTGVPKGKLLILDLQSDLTPQYETLDSYYGQPFIWCMLHNFGGQLGMYGYLNIINHGVIHGRSFQTNSTMVGVGVTPEGIDQNYIMYDFMLESSLHSDVVNLTDWVGQYIQRRYNIITMNDDDGIYLAWQILKNTVYNFEGSTLDYRKNSKSRLLNNNNQSSLNGLHLAHNVLTKRPSFRLFELVWYDKTEVFRAFELFVQSLNNSNLTSSKLLQHDAVDLTRQVLQIHIATLYENLILSFRRRDVNNFQQVSKQFLDLFDDLDKVLATNKKFLLGVWLENAKNLGRNINETLNYEFNARNQVTLWGPTGEIRDYAAKQWSGLILKYYKPRWEIFVKYLNESLTNNKKVNMTVINRKIYSNVEIPFVYDTGLFPTQPQGEALTVIQDIYRKLINMNLFGQKTVSHSKRFASELVSLVLI